MGAIGNHADVLVHADGLFVPTKSPLLCHCCPGIHRGHRSQGCGGELEGLTLKLNIMSPHFYPIMHSGCVFLLCRKGQSLPRDFWSDMEMWCQKSYKGWDIAYLVKCLASTHEAVGSIPRTAYSSCMSVILGDGGRKIRSSKSSTAT